MFLDGSDDIPLEELADHTKCEFGRWYYSSGKDIYGKEKIYIELGDAHERLHEKVKDIGRFKNTGDTNGASKAYDKVVEISRTVVRLLNGLKEKEKPTEEAVFEVEPEFLAEAVEE